jgi:FtsH-binding integral membrane protein
MWIFFGILLLVSAPVLVALGLLLSVPVAILLGISAWNDYTSPVPLEDALYRIPLFWVIEGVGVLVLLWLVAMLVDDSQRH